MPDKEETLECEDRDGGWEGREECRDNEVLIEMKTVRPVYDYRKKQRKLELVEYKHETILLCKRHYRKRLLEL